MEYPAQTFTLGPWLIGWSGRAQHGRVGQGVIRFERVTGACRTRDHGTMDVQRFTGERAGRGTMGRWMCNGSRVSMQDGCGMQQAREDVSRRATDPLQVANLPARPSAS